MKNDPLFYVVAAACLVVVVILMMGIGGFAKGNADGGKRANKIMRMRIVAQFIAIVLIVGYVWLRRS